MQKTQYSAVVRNSFGLLGGLVFILTTHPKFVKLQRITLDIATLG